MYEFDSPTNETSIPPSPRSQVGTTTSTTWPPGILYKYIFHYILYTYTLYTSTTTWPPGTPSMLASSWDAALLESFSSKFFIQNIKSDHFAHFPKNLCPRKFPKNFSKNFCPKTFLKAGNRGSSLLRTQPWGSPSKIAIQDRAHDDDLSITWPSFGLFRTQPGQIRNWLRGMKQMIDTLIVALR